MHALYYEMRRGQVAAFRMIFWDLDPVIVTKGRPKMDLNRKPILNSLCRSLP